MPQLTLLLPDFNANWMLTGLLLGVFVAVLVLVELVAVVAAGEALPPPPPPRQAVNMKGKAAKGRSAVRMGWFSLVSVLKQKRIIQMHDVLIVRQIVALLRRFAAKAAGI
ncbi:hypothetical protein [Vogesella sp. XCS3]|uniref:hypothetical protein n=1 Tax=Vogesella sp. XCS3 TaxID=2877939 RepID=UPI001D0B33D5|nr:hypothetical protein [Vogesella sp. XCS3]UDM16261.1 hypothetical protein LCH97_13300 [Vogesella sp. XCS3]